MSHHPRSSPFSLLALASAALLFSVACRNYNTLSREQEVAYRHPEYPYELYATPESPMNIMTGEWKADSVAIGTETFAEFETRGPARKVRQQYDWNQDGTPDHTEELARYELRLVHDTGAVVFIRAVPVPPSLGEASLAELAAAYLQAVSREGDMAARFSPADLPTDPGAKFEVSVLDEAPCRVSAVEAHRLEIVGRRVEPAPGPERRARLVIVRPGYRHHVQGTEDRDVPVMLVAAYTHAPDEFDALEDDFNRFLGRWVLRGYGEAVPTERIGHTCQP